VGNKIVVKGRSLGNRLKLARKKVEGLKVGKNTL